MKLQGRRQSGHVLDIRKPKDKAAFEATRGSLKVQREVDRNLKQDMAREIPKKMTGFSGQDMERSVVAQRVVKKLQQIGMKKR